MLSSNNEHNRTGIVTLESLKGLDMSQIQARLESKYIIVSVRDNKLRISPHCYNTIDEIDKVTLAIIEE